MHEASVLMAAGTSIQDTILVRGAHLTRHNSPRGLPAVVDAPPPRLSTSAAVQLMLEMDAQRQRGLLKYRLSWMAPTLYINGVHCYRITTRWWDAGVTRHGVSQRDIRAFGWDYALSRVPSIVIR